MSDRFHPISMEQLTAWTFTELLRICRMRLMRLMSMTVPS